MTYIPQETDTPNVVNLWGFLLGDFIMRIKVWVAILVFLGILLYPSVAYDYKEIVEISDNDYGYVDPVIIAEFMR